jgi:hypothetical protein
MRLYITVIRVFSWLFIHHIVPYCLVITARDRPYNTLREASVSGDLPLADCYHMIYIISNSVILRANKIFIRSDGPGLSSTNRKALLVPKN